MNTAGHIYRWIETFAVAHIGCRHPDGGTPGQSDTIMDTIRHNPVVGHPSGTALNEIPTLAHSRTLAIQTHFRRTQEVESTDEAHAQMDPMLDKDIGGWTRFPSTLLIDPMPKEDVGESSHRQLDTSTPGHRETKSRVVGHTGRRTLAEEKKGHLDTPTVEIMSKQ